MSSQYRLAVLDDTCKQKQNTRTPRNKSDVDLQGKLSNAFSPCRLAV